MSKKLLFMDITKVLNWLNEDSLANVNENNSTYHELQNVPTTLNNVDDGILNIYSQNPSQSSDSTFF